MKIVIFVSSRTGHTLKVSKALEKALIANGHSVRFEKIEPAEPTDLAADTVTLKTHPHIAEDDEGVILATPVNGGRISAPMRSWLVGYAGVLKPYRVAFLVTHLFSLGWGAQQALSELTEICGKQKSATILGYADVRWLSLCREAKIEKAVNKLTTLFQE